MLNKVILNLVRQQPFYAHLLNQVHLLEDPVVPIAGCSITEGKINLHLNSFVFSQLTLENQTHIVVHELLHLIGRHPIRIQNRQRLLWNIACDVAINQYIAGIPIQQKVLLKVEDGKGGWINEEREVGGITLDNVSLPDGTRVILPAQGFAEQYYNLLIEQTGGTTTKGNQGENIITGGEKGWGASMCHNALSELHPTWSEEPSSCQAIEEAVLRRAVEEAVCKCRGNLPGYLKEYVAKIVKSETPWRRILQMFLTNQTSEHRQTTFKKLNKRLHEYELPGYKRNRKLRIIVALDTSASIGSAKLAGFIAEVERIRRCGAEITLIECDCKVQKVYPLKRRIDPIFQGRGGTDFRPVWQYLAEQRLQPDAIIYLTDGRGQAPTGSLFPTLWALTSDGVKPWMSKTGGISEVNWGKIIKLDLI